MFRRKHNAVAPESPVTASSLHDSTRNNHMKHSNVHTSSAPHTIMNLPNHGSSVTTPRSEQYTTLDASAAPPSSAYMAAVHHRPVAPSGTPNRKTAATSCIPNQTSVASPRPISSNTSRTQTIKTSADDANARTANGNVINDRYKLERTIGKGSYGKVKLAVDLNNDNRPVAIKFIAKSSIKKPAHSTRIHREINLLTALHHPGIVELLEIIETEADIILVMEHIGGVDLYERIVNHPSQRFSEEDARPLVVQLVDAVAYCHRHRVVHRDLKPENVMVDNEGRVKLIDFGFANMYHPRGHLETNCGSPLYAAPEIVQGVRYVGPEVDVWSFGVVLFAVLTGMLPFEDEQLKGLYAKICAGHFSMPSHLSSGARDLLKSVLNTDPRQRLTMEQVARHPWITGFGSNPAQETLTQMQTSSNLLLPMRHAICAAPEDHILRAMAPLGFHDMALLRLTIRTDPDDPATAIYNLLVDRQRRTGSISTRPSASSANNIVDYYQQRNSQSFASRLAATQPSVARHPASTLSQTSRASEAIVQMPVEESSMTSALSAVDSIDNRPSSSAGGGGSSNNNFFSSPGSIMSSAANTVVNHIRKLRGTAGWTPRSVVASSAGNNESINVAGDKDNERCVTMPASPLARKTTGAYQ